MRLVGLDQIRFKGQCFAFTVGDDELDLDHLAHHEGDAGAEGLAITEIAAHPTAQGLGFADVQQPVFAVTHQVAARLGRQAAQKGLQPLGVLDQGLALADGTDGREGRAMRV